MPRLVALMLVSASCASGTSAPSEPPTSSVPPVSSLPSASPTGAPTTVAASTSPTSTVALVDRRVLADLSMTSVPADVIVPTSDASLETTTNPINGRRGTRRRLPAGVDCGTAMSPTCLTDTLDMLGFNITHGASDDERSIERATAVVQLDAGLPMTGVVDDDLLHYLDLPTDTTPEASAGGARQIGTSAKGRPIMAFRYGDGRRTVLVVGQTHGDEEGGLRVLLRARSLSRSLLDGITLWVIPTMNPDGLVLDTRFLVNGADPNRAAPSQLEQKAVYDFALAIRPSLTVWYHQNYGWVGGSGASMTPAKEYQAMTGLGALHRSGDCAKGFMWCPIDEAIGSSSILVELPDVLTPADVQKHALALLEVATST